MSKLERNVVYQRFYALIDSIPRGSVSTYGSIARAAGLPRHARHVGHALRVLPEGSKLPWHRVLNAKGEIALRPSAGYARQRRILTQEGVVVSARGCVDLTTYAWDPEAE